jgi:hypothetical protein
MSTVDRNVFVSYCHADAAWLERTKVHLRPLVRRGTLSLWDDTKISPGQAWREEVAAALARARVAVLLVSADFLASDFVINNELPPLLHRASGGGVLILPVLIGPCLFSEHEELARYQCVNPPDKPLSLISSPDAETVLVALARSVDKYFRFLEASTRQSDRASVPVSHAVEARLVNPATTAKKSALSSAAHAPLESLTYGPLVVDRPINLGFDGPTTNGVPVGWFNSFGYVSGVSTDYVIRVSPRSEDRTAGMCAALSNAKAAPGEFGSLMQRCPGRFRGNFRLKQGLRSEMSLDGQDWLGRRRSS